MADPKLTRDEAKSPIARAEQDAQTAAEHYRRRAADLNKAFGTRPWGEPRMTQREQLAAYAAVRDDPEFWKNSMIVEGKTLGLSDGLYPRKFIEDAKQMEARFRAAQAAGDLPSASDVPQPQQGV